MQFIKKTGDEETKIINLLDLNKNTNIKEYTSEIIKQEIKLTDDVYPEVYDAIKRLQNKLKEPIEKKFYLTKTLLNHILPLTNVCFDRSGLQCLTGSYDRTCRIWNVDTGDEELILKGHENVVFSVGYNTPKCDRIITGSFDKTLKIWNSVTAVCLKTLYGHTAEIVAGEFNPHKEEIVASASMDNTARIFHIETGQEIAVLNEHLAEVIVAKFSQDGNLLLTGSFDGSSMVWDWRTKK